MRLRTVFRSRVHAGYRLVLAAAIVVSAPFALADDGTKIDEDAIPRAILDSATFQEASEPL